MGKLPTGVMVAGCTICVIIGCIAGAYVQDLRFSKKIADLNSEHTNQLKVISDKAQADTDAAMQRTKDAQNAAAALDQQKTKDLANAKAENDRLHNDVANGDRRVRIAAANLATCQLTAGRNSSASGVGNGAEIELTAAAGQNILDIRGGIISDQAKLEYLQGYIRDVVKQCKR